ALHQGAVDQQAVVAHVVSSMPGTVGRGVTLLFSQGNLNSFQFEPWDGLYCGSGSIRLVRKRLDDRALLAMPVVAEALLPALAVTEVVSAAEPVVEARPEQIRVGHVAILVDHLRGGLRLRRRAGRGTRLRPGLLPRQARLFQRFGDF